MFTSRFGDALFASMIVVVMMIPGNAQQWGGCPGPANGYGPCSDSGATVTTGGAGWCGECSDLITVFAGGNCGGSAVGSDPPNCKSCNVSPKTLIYSMENKPVGSLMYAACYGSRATCYASGSLVCGSLCAYACRGNAACVSACETACQKTFLGDACECQFQGCINDCSPATDSQGNAKPPITSGSVDRCG